jgi:hypothetical protein
MDKWLTWLIPLIAIAVWILSQLAGNQQQTKRPSPRPFPPRDPEQDPRSRAPGDLEEFLESMKRRKEAEEQTAAERERAERERAAADRAVAQPVLIAEEVVPPRASPPPLPRPVEQRRKSVPVGNKKPPRRTEPVIVIEPPPVVRTVPMPMPAAAPAVTLATLPAVPAVPATPPAIHRPEALPAKTSLPPVARMVRDLLKSRQTLAAAILLREVLDPPLCKRRGR